MSVFNPFCKSRKLMREGGAGYSETETVLQMVCHADADDTTMYNIGDFVPEVGKTYKVTVDGVTSTNTAVSMVSEGTESVMLGNLAIFGAGDDTGEDWLIAHVPSEEVDMLVHRTKQYPETSELHIETETIHPIDKKYLPSDIGLPVVELETVITATLAGISEADCEKLNAVSGELFVLKCGCDLDGDGVADVTVKGIATFAEGMGMNFCNVQVFMEAELNVTLCNNGNGWQALYVYG